MNRSLTKVLSLLASIIMILTLAVYTASAEEPEEGMHIPGVWGEVEIIDATEQIRDGVKDGLLQSGDTIRTGNGGKAKVSVQGNSFVILDSNTQVQIDQKQDSTTIKLSGGTLLLDSQLESGKGMEVKTETLELDTLGGIVFVKDSTKTTKAGVLEGSARVLITDAEGTLQKLDVAAGEMITVANSESGEPIALPLKAADLEGFVKEEVLSDPILRQRVFAGSENGEQLLISGDQSEKEADEFPADGDWMWNEIVTLVAQSASKLYDGSPLTKTSDILVYGLPDNFKVEASADGSQTNAGSSENVVYSYAIYNSHGENVTSHFPYVDKISGKLVVDPAPLTVWTGSAEKYYDGEPLTSRKAEIKTVSWYTNSANPLRNSAVSVETETGTSALVAASGMVSVTDIDPETHQQTRITLSAGQMITAGTGSTGDTELAVVKLQEADIPDEVLRLYSENPQLLKQACEDAGWDINIIKERISSLSVAGEQTVNTITNSASISQNGDETVFRPIILDPTIKITTTGSQTAIGMSKNTYMINWGDANPDNYVIQESLGTLTVLAPKEHTEKIVLTAGSADKVYDGEALTVDNTDAAGIPEGYTVKVTLSGSQTDAGNSNNAIASYLILDPDGSDVTARFTNVTTQDGTLTVSPLGLTISCGGESVNYNGSTQLPVPIITYTNGAHAGETVNGVRMRSADAVYRFTLFTGDTVDVTVGGGGKNADTYNTTAAVSGIFGNASNFSISVSALSITINPAELVIESPDGSKPYDGTPLKASPAKITGLASGDELFVEITGSQQDVGESDNTFDLIWGDNTLEGNYNITETVGKLKVTVNSERITITANSAEKTYDGDPLSDSGFTVSGLPAACSVSANVVGEQTEVGSSDNVIESYTIYDSNDNDVTAYFTNRETVKGSLTVIAPGPSISYETGWSLVTYNGRYYQAESNFGSVLDSMRAQGSDDAAIIQYALSQGIIHTCSNAFSFNDDKTIVKYNGTWCKILNYNAFMSLISENPSMSDSDLFTYAINLGYLARM